MFVNLMDAQKIIMNNVLNMSKHTYPSEDTSRNTSILKFCNRFINSKLL